MKCLYGSAQFKVHPLELSMWRAQSAASIACRELGFEKGRFQNLRVGTAEITLLPAWLGAVPCVGVEASITDCGLEYGSTAGCGAPQQLACTNGSGAIISRSGRWKSLYTLQGWLASQLI